MSRAARRMSAPEPGIVGARRLNGVVLLPEVADRLAQFAAREHMTLEMAASVLVAEACREDAA